MLQWKQTLIKKLSSKRLDLSDVASCKEQSSNLHDDPKIGKLILVNLLVIFYLKPIKKAPFSNIEHFSKYAY